MEKLLDTTGQMRGLKKMRAFFESLGKWRLVIGIATIVGTIAIYAFLPFLPIKI